MRKRFSLPLYSDDPFEAVIIDYLASCEGRRPEVLRTLIKEGFRSLIEGNAISTRGPVVSLPPINPERMGTVSTRESAKRDSKEKRKQSPRKRLEIQAGPDDAASKRPSKNAPVKAQDPPERSGTNLRDEHVQPEFLDEDPSILQAPEAEPEDPLMLFMKESDY